MGKDLGAHALHETSSAQDVTRLLTFLEEQGTFRFPTLANGLFSAAAGAGAEFEVTGYRHVWVRDNIHIANAHAEWGETNKAIAAIRSLMAFYLGHQHRLTDIISGRVDPTEPMHRPHIRFNGDQLQELDEKWSHAQNDALGAFLWLSGKLAHECQWSAVELKVLDLMAEYLRTVEFWQDEDSGHWEEVRKVAASSIGVVTAALNVWGGRFDPNLKEHGQRALASILPSECIQADPAKSRRYDAALLFLIYPYRVVSGSMAEQIVRDVTTNLMGEYGVRRYLGDSYWCADYKDKLSADVRTADFSDNLSMRDKLLEPGLEAQWCLFDPIISIHYGLRYDQTRDPQDRQQQLHYLNRSLSQLTSIDSRFGAYRCPESYFCEKGTYVPNDICPLLWTQANLKLALTHLVRSLT
ncbi:glycoside hydrolase family 15 protein [Schlesneria paludicola]|uniref:glycoside hydrolase family 15 protein n=1 Tax=Schlesneria paludicola TaxID=360056 RepID=UPI00029B2150|nr:glycoside hydrolase family 15 protein [Schlesneria paludicola]